MDRLLFGDNQFFGVNHMSEEKARAQAMRFQSLDAVMRGPRRRLRRGRAHVHVHDARPRRRDLRPRAADPERYADFAFYPCMPYAHKYANAVTEDGMLGALKRFLPGEGLMNAAIRGGSSMAKKDIDGITTLLIDAEMKMFEGLRTPVVFLQNVIVDLLLGLGFDAAFRVFADHVRERYGAEPGFITMNLPALLPVLEAQGIENPIVCSNINKIGFRMSGGVEAYERTLREHRFRAIAMSVFASGAIPAEEAIEWVCAQPNLESIVFGASSARNIQQTRDLVARHWDLEAGARMTTLLVASTGGHLKQLHRLHRRLDGVEGPFRWATFDTPQSRSLLAGEDVDFVHFVGGRDPGNVLRNVPLVHRILREHDIDTIVSTGSAMALPFYALGRARGLDLHYIESAARSDGPSKTARHDRPHPGREPVRAVPVVGGREVAVPRRRVRLVHRRRRAAPPAAGDLRKVVVSLGHVQGLRLRAPRQAAARDPARRTPRCCGRPATPTSAGSASTATTLSLSASSPRRSAMPTFSSLTRASARRWWRWRSGRCPVLVPRRLVPRRARGRPPDPDRRRALAPRPGRDRRSGRADARSPHHRRCDQGRRAGRGSAVPARRRHPCPSPILGTDAVAAGTPRSPHLACFVATPRWHGFGQRSER